MTDAEMLNYARADCQKSRSQKRRWIACGVFLVVMCALIGYGSYANKLYRRSVVRGFDPSRVHKAESPAKIFRLQADALAETAARHENVIWQETGISAGSGIAVAGSVTPWSGGSRSGVTGSVKPWFAFLSPANVMNLDEDFDQDIVYTGMRHAANGSDRIVVVRIFSWLDVSKSGTLDLSLLCTVLTPATLTQPPSARRTSEIPVFLTPAPDARSLYTGLSDPADPAMFSIRLDHGNSTSILRGTLMTDDTVTWSIAPGGLATLATNDYPN